MSDHIRRPPESFQVKCRLDHDWKIKSVKIDGATLDKPGKFIGWNFVDAFPGPKLQVLLDLLKARVTKHAVLQFYPMFIAAAIFYRYTGSITPVIDPAGQISEYRIIAKVECIRIK